MPGSPPGGGLAYRVRDPLLHGVNVHVDVSFARTPSSTNRHDPRDDEDDDFDSRGSG